MCKDEPPDDGERCDGRKWPWASSQTFIHGIHEFVRDNRNTEYSLNSIIIKNLEFTECQTSKNYINNNNNFYIR